MAVETRLLNDGHPDGTSFILGLDGDKPEEGVLNTAGSSRLVMSAFERDDVATIVVPAAREAAQKIVESSDGRLDAVEILDQPRMRRYANVLWPESSRSRKNSSTGTIAMSGYLFGPPFDRPCVHKTVLAGAESHGK